MASRILVVDDDPETCRFMEELLRASGREIVLAGDPATALRHTSGGGLDLVVSDINLNAELSGLDLLRAFKQADSAVEVVLISGFGTLETAIEAVRAGAFDYISKPFNITEVKDTVERALRRRARTLAAPPRVGDTADDDQGPDGLVGRSRAMLAVYKLIAHASASDAPVLITGETGTGKELVAHAIHRHGPRERHPFVPVNCGALAEGLLESELFGHVRGSFTGAISDKKGLFEQAHGGTLFLDEIGETPPAVQVRLLRALESGEVRPVGSTRVVQVDVRVIGATHRDIERAVREGVFRQDLFYRLNVFHVHVPALRERREDVPLLVQHFLRDAAESGTAPAARITHAAVEALTRHAWPGNVRELLNTVERLALAARGGEIDVDDLPPPLQNAAPPSDDELFKGLPSLDQLEKRYLQHVLAATHGNRTHAADILGIDRRTLYRMAERFGLELDEIQPGAKPSAD